MNHRKPSILAILAVGAVVSLGAAAIAQQYDDPTSADMMSGVVVTSGTGEIVVETSDGRKTFMIGDSVMMPAGLAEGDIVLIDVDSPGSLNAEKVMIVHDHIVVIEDEESEGALLGVVTAISPQQLLVHTTTGEQAFVINPEKLFPPLPEADQKVAVTYRTLEVHPPQHMATGLVVLPNDLDALTMSARGESSQAEAEIAAETIEAEAEAETVAPVPLAETEVESEPESLSEDELAAAQTTPETSTQADQPVQEDSFAETDPAEAELESEAIAEAESPAFEPEPETEFQAQPEPLAEEQLAESETTFDEDEEALPQTGSSLPLLLGFGALALGLAAALRSAR